MSLFRFFRRASETPGQPSGPIQAPPQAPAPTTPSSSSFSPPPAPAGDEASGSDGVARAIEMFETIQEVMGRSEDVVQIPARVLLSSLPPELRGPAWDERAFPDSEIELEREPLLRQLQRGRVTYRLDELVVGIPPDWIKSDPEAMVELNLAELVGALPPEIFQTSAQLDEELIEVAQMRDYFAPRGAEVETPPPVSPAPAVAVAASSPPPPEAPRPLTRREVPLTARDGWDGVEHEADAGPESVDINEADAAALASLPGMGKSRARLVAEYRDRFGPFRSIYELLAVPGIGWAVFRKATGLEPGLRKRRDRHAVLSELLGLPREKRPSLAQIAELIPAALPARACVLAGQEGFVLAQSAGVDDDAARYAAIAPKLFRRTRRYLKQLSRSPVNAILLPTAEPPVLAIGSSVCHMIIVLDPAADGGAVAQKAVRIAAEIEWLLSRRAIVRAREAVATGT